MSSLIIGGRTPASRCTVSLSHYRSYRQPVAFEPTSAAVAGALDIYLGGRRDDDVLRMLFGLSIMRSATGAQVDAALTARGATIAADPAWDSQQAFDLSFSQR